MCDISSDKVFSLLLRHGVTLVLFLFSFFIIIVWLGAIHVCLFFSYSDCCLVLGGCFHPASVSFRFFLRVGKEKALSYNIIEVSPLRERFLLLGTGWVCFLGVLFLF